MNVVEGVGWGIVIAATVVMLMRLIRGWRTRWQLVQFALSVFLAVLLTLRLDENRSWLGAGLYALIGSSLTVGYWTAFSRVPSGRSESRSDAEGDRPERRQEEPPH